MPEKKENKVLNFITSTLGGMANGLFATLIIGTIFGTIAMLIGLIPNSDFYKGLSIAIKQVSSVLKMLTGVGIGVGIALVLKFDTLKTITLGAVGEIAAYFSVSSGEHPTINTLVGDPLTIYLVCISVALLMMLVLKQKTSVDILIVPLFGITIGFFATFLLKYPAYYVTYGVQFLIAKGATVTPFFTGIIVSVLMGMALTAPISSAAIGFIIFSGSMEGLAIASGAAVVGCSVQMVGFAVQSIHDNKPGQVISIGIGTSMLQFKNIVKKPLIWLPTIIVSAILGPVATCWLKLSCDAGSAGMGTAGLVGQIGTFTAMGNTWQTWVGIFALEIVLPGVLTFFVDLLFRKIGLIKKGDLEL